MNTEAVSEAKFSPDGMQIIIAYDDGKVALYDLNTSEKLFDLNSHQKMVMSVVFSPDTKYK